MSENGQNIRPEFMDAIFLGVNPEKFNEREQSEAARLFLHAVIAHEVGNKEVEEIVASKDYIEHLNPETRDKVRILLTESEWAHGLSETTRLVKLGNEIREILQEGQEIKVG